MTKLLNPTTVLNTNLIITKNDLINWSTLGAGNGLINTYWCDGYVTYRNRFGICELCFDLTVKIQTSNGAVLASDLPKCMNTAYNRVLLETGNGVSALFYMTDGGSSLICDNAPIGRYTSTLSYQTI